MAITGPDARTAAPGQAVVDTAMLVLERMGLTPADLLAAPAAKPGPISQQRRPTPAGLTFHLAARAVMVARAGAHPFGRKNLYTERASRVPWCPGPPLVLPRVLEEVAERCGEFVRCLLSLVVAGVDEAAAQFAGRPRPPDRLGITVNVKIVVRGGEQQHRAPDLPARGPVGFLVRAVGSQAASAPRS